MSSNIAFRVLLAFYAFCLALVSILAITVTLGLIPLQQVSDTVLILLEDGSYRIMLFSVSFLFLLLSIIFLLSGVQKNQDKKYVSKYTNIGEVRISLNTLENITLATAKKLAGIREAKAFVRRAENGVSISVRTVVVPDINIPALSEDLQMRVKNAVEEATGIQVQDIKVLVDNITGGIRARVE